MGLIPKFPKGTKSERMLSDIKERATGPALEMTRIMEPMPKPEGGSMDVEPLVRKMPRKAARKAVRKTDRR